MNAEPEKLAFVTATYVGTPKKVPDSLLTIDVHPASGTYSQVIHRLPMPSVGDELYHFGWNACSSCHGDPKHQRQFLVIPRLRSTRIHIVDVADPHSPKMHKVIAADEIIKKTGLTSPHTVTVHGAE
jgi:selenium-binding protein 1